MGNDKGSLLLAEHGRLHAQALDFFVVPGKHDGETQRFLSVSMSSSRFKQDDVAPISISVMPFFIFHGDVFRKCLGIYAFIRFSFFYPLASSRGPPSGRTVGSMSMCPCLL